MNAGESSRGYHRLITLDECTRKYGFRYGLKLEPQRNADAPALGSLLHVALMHRHLQMMGADALEPAEAMRRAPARIAHCFSKAVEVWSRYLPWAESEDKAFRVLDVEREYEARIDGRRITARLDLVAEQGGRVIVIDHKSTSSILAAEIRAQAMKGQIALEEAIGEGVLPAMYGMDFGGVWINAIGTAGQEPIALRGRCVVPASWRLSVMDALGALLRHAEAVEDLEGWGTEEVAFSLDVSPEACWGRYAQGRCDYFDLCRQGPGALRSMSFDRGQDEVTILREGAGA